MKIPFFNLDTSRLDWDQFGQAAAVALAFALPISTAATNILSIMIFISWVLGPNRQEKWRIVLFHPLAKWIYPLILIAFIGITYSSGRTKDIYHGLNDALRLGFIPIFIYFFQSKRVATAALWAFTAAMVFTLVLAYLKVYAGLPIGLKYTTGAIFKSHIKTSYFMGIAAFFLALKAKEIPRLRLPFVLLIALMVYYLLCMSVGRIGYLTFAICLLVTAWQWYRIKGILCATMLGVIMFVGAFYASDLFHQRVVLLGQDLDIYHEGGRLLDSSLGSRLTFTRFSLELMSTRPIIGFGTGSFGTVYENFHIGKNTLLTDNPHNEYLRMGVEFGLLGVGLLLLLFFQQWRLSRYLEPQMRDFWQGILLTFMFGCVINSWLRDFTEAYFFCLMTAICFSKLPLLVAKSRISAPIY